MLAGCVLVVATGCLVVTAAPRLVASWTTGGHPVSGGGTAAPANATNIPAWTFWGHCTNIYCQHHCQTVLRGVWVWDKPAREAH